MPTVQSPANPVPAYRQSAEEIIASLNTSAERGLTRAEARARLNQFGKNELAAEKPLPAWRKFLAQFQDVLVVLLLIATAISFGLWLYERSSALPYEAIAILAVVLLNAVMGFVQTERAAQAVASLREMSAAEATVIRDGDRCRIHASEIVPGDIIQLEEGDTIPADARLIETTALQTAEAALTGESVPVSKHSDALTTDAPLGDRRNCVFSGTAVTYGRGKAVVTGTGMDTELGHIAGMLKAAPTEVTPLQKQLDRTGKMLGVVVVIIAVVMIATIVLAEHVTGFSGLLDVLILGVALAVAAVPEGLPAIVTVVLSLGVQRMAKRNAIVRHLSAVETLGSANVIASDKTGTLTKNEMTVRSVVTASGFVELTGGGYDPEGEVRQEGKDAIDSEIQSELRVALTAAERANNADLQTQDGRWLVQGDPTEGSLLVAARKAGLDPAQLKSRFPRVGEVPFSSERKRMTTLHKDNEQPGATVAFAKGAPDVLLGRCSHEFRGDDPVPLTDERRSEILQVTEDMAGRALRTLGVAYRRFDGETAADESIENDFVFAGVIGMIDPPRPEAKEAVSEARNAGIRPIMITGDHPRTAAVIARELGIATEDYAVTGADLGRCSDEELEEKARGVSVYARVNPEHKLRIVQALRGQGCVVAMTGDGVNDAPALKSADIGIAMGITGTDVSKEVADMILTDDNFASIVAAVEEGRAIFSNIRKFLRYLLSSNIGEVMTMFFGVLFAKQMGLTAQGDALVLPLLATQILWINLVTDGAPALALGVDPADHSVMERPPRPQSEGVITKDMWRGILFVGVIMAAATLGVLDASLPGGLIEGVGDMRYAQTMAFTTLMMAQLFNVFNARSDRRSAFPGFFRNPLLLGAVALSLLLHVAVIYLPFLQQAFSTTSLALNDWLKCAVAASFVLWLRELSKVINRAAVSR